MQQPNSREVKARLVWILLLPIWVGLLSIYLRRYMENACGGTHHSTYNSVISLLACAGLNAIGFFLWEATVVRLAKRRDSSSAP